MADAGLNPDPWQASLLLSDHPRTAVLASRQSGKSLWASAMALRQALLVPNSLVLIFSPSQRQSSELFNAKICWLYDKLHRPVRRYSRTATMISFVNGSRIVSLPENPDAVVGYSGVSLLIIDEASRVSDELYKEVRPMLATCNGKLIAISTPFGQRGWFFEAWGSDEPWLRARITAENCPRITKAFLEEELKSLGERYFRQNYSCSFEAGIDTVFDLEVVRSSISSEIQPFHFN